MIKHLYNSQFIIITSIVVISISVLLQYETFTNEITYVKSNIDGKSYLVRNLPDKKEAADLLAITKTNCVKLVKYLKKKFPTNPAVKRLSVKYNPDNITESSKKSKYTSYSVNKGEKIVFCIRSRDSNEKLIDNNTLMFVALHELAHIMTKSIGHTEEFWDNFRFLLKGAIAANIYQYQDFRKKPVKYCGTEITDTPLNDDLSD